MNWLEPNKSLFFFRTNLNQNFKLLFDELIIIDFYFNVYYCEADLKKSVLYKVLFKAGLNPIFDSYIKDI